MFPSVFNTFVLISNKTPVCTRGYEHWVNIYQTVFCMLTLLYFVTIHCVNVRLITWNPDLLAWRISILKYIRVIIHCTFWSLLKNLPAFIFLLSSSTKGNHFLSCWWWPGGVCNSVSSICRIQGWIWNASSTFLHHLKLTPYSDAFAFQKATWFIYVTAIAVVAF